MLEVNQLNREQFQNLLDLQQQVKKKAKYNAPLYIHIIRAERPYPCNILAYQGRELIGFSSRFLFHDGEVEFSLIMHPKFKSAFLAKKLLIPLIKYVPPEYKKTVVIATPHQQSPDIHPDKNWEYVFSSHRLQWVGVCPKPSINEELEIIKAQTEHFNIFQEIIHTCFPNGTQMIPEIYQQLMSNPLVQIYLLKKHDDILGAIQINQENKIYRISDVSILPKYRQKGYANYLLSHILHQLSNKHKDIILDVESRNQFVLQLYLRIGMKEINICDYWRIPFHEIF